MNTDLRKKAKNYFENDVFKLMNDVFFFGENRDIKLVATERRTN